MDRSGRNPWAVLGLAEPTTLEAARRAFRRAAQTCHPDHGGDAVTFAAAYQAFAQIRRMLAGRPDDHRWLTERAVVRPWSATWFDGPERVVQPPATPAAAAFAEVLAAALDGLEPAAA